MRLAALLLAPLPLVASAPSTPVERLADAALAFAQAEAQKLGGTYRFKLAQPPRVPPPARPGVISFEASHLSKREPMGHFFVVLTMKLDGEKVGMVRVDLDGTWAGSLLRAKGNLTRGTVLTEEQVEASVFEGLPPEAALTELPEGMRVMRAVAAGKILTRGDLEVIPLIQSGDRVRLTSSYGPLSISLDTTARSRGALGDRVRLEAPGSRRPVIAIITGPAEARLQN